MHTRGQWLVPDLLFAVSWVAGAWLAYGVGTDLARWRGVVMFCALVALLGIWLARRRAPRRWQAPVFALITLSILIVGVGGLMLPLVLVTLLLLVLDAGVVVGILFAVLACAAAATTMLVVFDASALEAAMETGGVALFLLFGLTYGMLLRQAHHERMEREQALVALDATNTKLQAANAGLRRSAARERELVLLQERARSARELHDGLGHRLTVVSMSLDYATRMRLQDPDRAWSEVATARVQVSDAMAEMRMWVRALHPAEVGQLDGSASFDAIAATFRGTGLEVCVETAGDEQPLTPAVSLLCHRVIQEGLTNAVRHAKASRVDIGVDYDASQLRLKLSNNRSGASTVTREDPVVEGFGLRSLRER
ncbi:MAG: histidine kinase, partial [Micrococcales bacterium]|nr:histidine kinase [Micrococcales bacterium]